MKNEPKSLEVFVSRNLVDTARCAQRCITDIVTVHSSPSANRTIKAATILALSGELGAGKTAFVKVLAEALGIKETITSPTFVIEQIYLLPKGATVSASTTAAAAFDRLIHIDAYRLEKASELERLGWEEIAANPRNIICLEWPENVVGLSHLANAHQLKFRFVDENTREISFE